MNSIRHFFWSVLIIGGKALGWTKITHVSICGVPLGERLFRLSHTLFRPPNPARTADNNIMYLPRPSLLGTALAVKGVYEPATTAFFKEALKPGMTVVDVGANVGYYTLLAARLVGGEGRVYAFEPEPENFALLEKNVQANGFRNVVCLQQAVSDRCGRVPFYLSWGSEAHSLSAEVSSTSRSIEVASTSLDDFFRKEGWPSIDLIKMDIEGAETLALEGMKELIERSNNLSIITEFSQATTREAGVEPSSVPGRLHGMGFHIRVIDEVNWLQPRHMFKILPHYQNLLCERGVKQS